jgi:hypothetical protein
LNGALGGDGTGSVLNGLLGKSRSKESGRPEGRPLSIAD